MPQSHDSRQAASQPSHPSIIDLRQFAREVASAPASQVDGQADAFLANRYPLELPPGPVEFGAIRLEAGTGSVAELPADEFIILCDGNLTLNQQGQTLELADSASAVLSAGAGFHWHCPQPATLLYMRYKGESAGEGSLIAIDDAALLEPSGTPLVELLIGPTPSCRNHTDYRSVDGEFMCGTWDSTPYHRRAMESRQYELMHLLAGAVTVVEQRGTTRTFTKGDICLVEKGAEWSWESLEDVKKVYAIYRPV
ncbi:cupin domain-containing protein [Halomonas kalidii]|uniref:Cupin domain-containing protein n=1 Tax=Halomonas kalidii TaxID=3043293 RepID=A0ABT6VQ49_9GAMM|nr:cupin domain-containing protein [Halomonas kalidii]MDI5936106.1 cupin domain-containing protein [Halomonas kalidii]